MSKLFLLIAACFVGGLRSQFATANVETAAGTHKVLTRRSDAALTSRHLLVKAGSDALHAAVCGAGDYPIGSTTDSPAAAEEILNVNPLNNSEYTRRLRCATALAANIDVYTAANGFVQGEPAAAGTYYKVGRTVALAVQEAANSYVVEVAPCAPVKLIVVAALTSTNGTAADAADLAALKAEAEKIGDDVRALGAALATPALVKVLAE